MTANNQFDSITKILVDSEKCFFKNPELIFYKKFRHPRNPRAKNQNFLKFHFERFWRCAGRGHTLLCQKYPQRPSFKGMKHPKEEDCTNFLETLGGSYGSAKEEG
jgi:hypothetical protein